MDKKKKKLGGDAPPLPAAPPRPPNDPNTNSTFSSTPSSAPSSASAGSPPLFTCDICAQDSLTEEEMRTHVLLQHVEGGITCPFCDLEGTTVEEMNQHVNSSHLDYLSLNGGSRVEVGGEVDRGEGRIGAGRMNERSAMRGIGRGASKYSSLESSTSAKTASSYATSVDEAGTSSGGEQSSLASTVQQPLPWTTLSDEEEMDDSDSSTLPTTSIARADVNIVAENREQSLKRAKLYLDVPNSSGTVMETQTTTRTKFVPGNPNHNAFSCPFCPWVTSCPKEIGQHVNSKHMDILSPAKPIRESGTDELDSCNNNKPHLTKTPSSSSSPSPSLSSKTSKQQQQQQQPPFVCPICSWATTEVRHLETHVHTIHMDILSPGGRSSSRGGRLGRGGGATPMSVGGWSTTSGGTGTSGGSPLQTCPMCGMEFSDTDSLTQHADGHFSAEHTPEVADSLLAQELERRELAALRHKEEREFERMQQEHCSLRASKTSVKKFQQDQATVERIIAEPGMPIPAAIDDGHTCTPGIIGKLQQYYKQSNYVQRHWLASPVDHYAGAFTDKGWGCGYRNLQMMLSCLKEYPPYERVLFNGRPLIPSIAKIQRLIESAWAKGFDAQGCEQLGGRVVNTNKWIGATEIVATLSSLKIKCQLLDFHYPAGPGGTHPRLFEWVRDYFRRDAPFKPPLYLQHQGHSRTIVGIEEYKDGALKLLIFDPSSGKRQMNQFVSGGDITNNMMKSLRRSMAGLKAKQYQIVAVVNLLSDADYEDNKLLKSERIPR